VIVTHVGCGVYCLDRGRFGYGCCGCHLSVLLRYSTFTFGFKTVSGCASIVWFPSGLMCPQGLPLPCSLFRGTTNRADSLWGSHWLIIVWQLRPIV
jgi:hypothetical protein